MRYPASLRLAAAALVGLAVAAAPCAHAQVFPLELMIEDVESFGNRRQKIAALRFLGQRFHGNFNSFLDRFR